MDTDANVLLGMLDGSVTHLESSAITYLPEFGISCLPNLTSVYLPSVETIESYGGYYDGQEVSTDADSDTLPGVWDFPACTTCGSYAFYFNCGMGELNLPMLETVPSALVMYAENLSILRLDSATYIPALAFNMAYLSHLVLGAPEVCTLAGSLYTSAMFDVLYIYVPSDLVESYQSATNWSTYADQILAIEDYPDICGG